VSDDRRTQAQRWTGAVWGKQFGYFLSAYGIGGHFDDQGKYEFKSFHQRPGRWPDDRDRFLNEALERAERDDVFVAPYLRSVPDRKKGSALPSDVLYADLDEAPDGQLMTPGGVLLLGPGGLLVSSGLGRHVYARLPEELEPDELEVLNRHLAFALGADAGWSENKVLRLPGTFNHKPRARGGASVPVELLAFRPALKDWTPSELVDLLGPALPTVNLNGAGETVEPVMPEEVPPHLRDRLQEEPGDRSEQHFAFVAACIEAGLSDAEVIALALEHRPTKLKYEDRAAAEIARSLAKLRQKQEDTKPVPTGRRDLEPDGPLDWELLSEIPMRSIKFLDEPLWQADAFHLLVGRKAVGKGTVLADLTARCTSGELGEKRNVVWIASEDSAAIDIGPRVTAAGGDTSRVVIVKTWVQLPRDVDRLGDLLREVGDVGLLIVDPMGNHITGKNSSGDTDIRAAIAPLNGFADEHGLMVVGIRHLSEKEATAGALAAILGASAWVQVPRTVIGMARDGEGELHIQCLVGNRLPPDTPGRTFQIEGVEVEGLTNEVTRAVWTGESSEQVETMIAAKPTTSSYGMDQARELILDILDGEGEQESDALDARVAKATGLAARTVKDVRHNLGGEGLLRAVPLKDETNAVTEWRVVRTRAPR
jgi:AAA domain-containing protein